MTGGGDAAETGGGVKKLLDTLGVFGVEVTSGVVALSSAAPPPCSRPSTRMGMMRSLGVVGVVIFDTGLMGKLISDFNMGLLLSSASAFVLAALLLFSSDGVDGWMKRSGHRGARATGVDGLILAALLSSG